MYVDDDVMFGRPYTFSNVPRKLDDKKGCFSFVFELHECHGQLGFFERKYFLVCFARMSQVFRFIIVLEALNFYCYYRECVWNYALGFIFYWGYFTNDSHK